MNQYSVLEVGTNTQLLIDDYVVDDVWMIRRAPETPVKYLENPILPHRGGTVIYDHEDKIFKMWYGIPVHGAFKNRIVERETRGAYAVSSDGINWDKPHLGLVEHDGSRNNNVIATNGFGHVLKDPHDPDPNRRYKMMTKRFGDRLSEGRAFAAFSPDGIRWHNHPGEKSIIRASDDGNGCVVYDESTRRYINFRRPTIRAARRGDWTSELGMPETGSRQSTGADGKSKWEEFVFHGEAEDYIHRYLRKAPYINTKALRLHKKSDGPCNRRIARAESEDFINWTEPEVIIRPDELDPAKLYGISVFQYRGLYLGFLDVYDSWGGKGDHQSETMETQLTFSRDGWNWERLASRPVFLPRGLIGSFDGGMISSICMVEHGEDLFFYYHGSNHSHNIPGSTRGLGLARLPKERLVARTAADAPGMLITKPFTLEGRELMINANADGGVIKAEITDAIGNPLPGLELENCRNVDTNAFRIPIQWGRENKLEHWQGQVVRIRFVLRHAKLYSFTLC